MQKEYAMGRVWEVESDRHTERLNFFKEQFREILSNEPRCEDCGAVLSPTEEEHCGKFCFDCFSKIDIEDYQTERPRD